MGLFDGAANLMLPKLLKSGINSKLDNIGEVTELDINIKEKKLWGKLALRGEAELVNFEVKFDIIKEGENYFIVIKDIFTTKIWLNNAFRTYGRDKKIPLKEEYSKYISMLM